MNKKLTIFLAAGILLGGIGLGAYTVNAAQAVQTAAPASPASQTNTPQDEQAPAYSSSIKTANPQDAGDKENQDREAKEEGQGHDAAEEGQDNEAVESTSLQSVAKITVKQAEASALKAVPGKVTGVALENENGNVVYSVGVQTTTGITDVKIDAGNAQVLSQDRQQDRQGDHESDQEKEDHESDNDHVESEH